MIETRKAMSEDKYEDIIKAINHLKNAGKEINKSSVAKQAKCSRTTLYKYPEIVEQIEGIVSQKTKKQANKATTPDETKEQRRDRIKRQYNRIKELERELNLAMLQLVQMENLEREVKKKQELIERQKGIIDKQDAEIIKLKALVPKKDIKEQAKNRVADITLKTIKK